MNPRTELPDVVIPVRVDEKNEELRYTLRSIAAHLPHSKVWITGYIPKWVVGVEHLPKVEQRYTKFTNLVKSIVAACQHPELSEEFILCDDDMFTMEPQPDGLEIVHRGVIRDFLIPLIKPRSSYHRGLETTNKILEQLGFENPLNYEVHVPIPLTKSGLLEAFNRGTVTGLPRTPVLQLRTLYGNIHQVGGKQVQDVKIHKMDQPFLEEIPFVSTTNSLWGKHPVTDVIKEMFNRPGPYEVSK